MEGIVRGYIDTGTGTPAATEVACGFVPERVELTVQESSLTGFWDSNMRAGTFQITDIHEIRTGDVIIGAHLPRIGTTDTQIRNDRCVAYFNGAGATAIEVAAVAAGTAFTASTHDVTANSWGCFKLCVQTGGTVTITPDSSLASSTEAAAILLQAANPSNEACLGLITVQATSGAIFNATTDALAGGTTGTPANATNYYEGYGVMEYIGGGTTAAYGITVKGNTAGDTYHGFELGVSPLLNIARSRIYYKAYRS